VYAGGEPYPILSLSSNWNRIPSNAEDVLGKLPRVMDKYKLDAWTIDQPQTVVGMVSQTPDGGWQAS